MRIPPGERPPGNPSRRLTVAAGAAAIACFAAAMTFAAWRIAHPAGTAGAAAVAGGRDEVGAQLQVAAALRTADTRGYARALAPRPFRFPQDHGPHPDFRTEWWYYTGNLAADDGRRFGFQLTFFRVALAPPGPPGAAPRTSAWATRQIYFAHFALTDVASRRFAAFERWQRQALGLAGAQAAPFHVWVGDWSADAALPASQLPAGGALPPVRLTAAAPGGAAAPAIDLVLSADLAPVPQGDHGLSAKSAAAGNASYYYSLPRLAARGTLRVGGERIAVHGLAWMDREWSTSALAAAEVGWDWFALQLDDGWELMLYRLRRQPAAPPASAARQTPGAPPDAIDPASRATLIAPDGATEQLPPAAWSLTPTAAWTSPASHIRYPSGWHLRLPASGPPTLDLTVLPLLADQELRLSLRYWEGAVAVRGSHRGRPVGGSGYVELTGYGDATRQEPLPSTAAPTRGTGDRE